MPMRATSIIPSVRILPLVLLVLLAPPPKAEANEFFGLTNVWTLEIHSSRSDWKAITSGARLSTDFGAVIHIDGKKYENVRIRPKGGGTTVGTSRGRPPLRLTFTKDSPSEAKELSLNNNVYDSSFVRDALSYKLFRDFSVPAPRTAFAKIYVVLSGEESRRYAGLYTISEVVDEGFTKRNFGIGSGLILKPELANQGFGKGSSWEEVKARFYPKTEATKLQQERVLSFIRLLNEAHDPTFRGEIESYVDLDNYLRFVAVNVVLANLDSYLGMGKNYYVYLNPKTNKLQWIPWDHDLSFGGFFLCGTTEQRINLSIDQPSSVNDRLLERVMEMPGIRKRYHNLIREFLEKHFNQSVLFKQIDELASLLALAVDEEGIGRLEAFKSSIGKDRVEMGRGHRPQMPAIKTFIEARVQAINAQLDGTAKGDQPSFWQRQRR